MSDTRLIVPIDVAALCIGAGDVTVPPVPAGAPRFARITDRFDHMPYLNDARQIVNPGPNISESIAPSLFQDNDEPLDPGVHLHWALPDSLAHGVSGTDGTISFREAPNRWLVVRMATMQAGTPNVVHNTKAWVVESDRLWDKEDWQATNYPDLIDQNLDSRAVPVVDLARQTAIQKPFQAMGCVFPFETWSESPSGAVFADRNAAVGYGNPTFAAAYPHCRNVFGFHDDLADLVSGGAAASASVSYLVAGWYSPPQGTAASKDPLALIVYDPTTDATPQQKLPKIQSTYGWTFPVSDTTPIPSATICSGLLLNIGWHPAQAYLQARAGTTVDVAIGNNATEALSALAAEQFPHLSDAEDLLNALQFGLLSKLGQPGGHAALENALHQRTFGSTSGGDIFVVKRPGAGAPDSGPVTVNSEDLMSAAGQEPLSDAMATALDVLNDSQLLYDKTVLNLDARRGQIFADWYKFMMLNYDPEHPDTNAAYEFIKDEAALVDLIAGDGDAVHIGVNQRAAERNLLRTSVQGLLTDGFVLKPAAAPRFWQPSEPAVLVSGTDLNPSARYGEDGRFQADGYLCCRVLSTLVSSMTAGAATIASGDLPHLAANASVPCPDEIAALVCEAALLDSTQAWLLAQAVMTKDPTIKNLAGLIVDIQTVQANLLQTSQCPFPIAPPPATSARPTFSGTLPSPVGVQAWTSPWIPLILQWEVQFAPALSVGANVTGQPTYPSNFIRSGYQLDADDIELTPRATAQPIDWNTVWSSATSYEGMVLLTHNAEVDIKGQINAYLQQFPEDPYATELTTIRDQLRLSAMAQALSGLHQALLMRRQSLQLPVGDPVEKASPMRYAFSNQTVVQAVDDENNLAAVPEDSYNPLRTGYMRLTRLRIIDAFGQVRDLSNPPIARAKTLLPVVDSPDHQVIALPPRFTQPARLLFRWLAASTPTDEVESNSHPATTPIFGWVIFNHLDQALAIYDADGSPRGSLSLKGELWQGAPGNDATYGKPIEAAFADANKHLAAFALGISQNPDARMFVAKMLAAIDRSTMSIEPTAYKQDPGLSVLIGRPLALARAMLNLELQGPPALDQSWTAFDNAFPDNFDARGTAAFEQVDVPVRLGDLSQVNDGLVGYFIDDGSASVYTTFYAPASQTSDHGVLPPSFDRLLVRADDKAPPIKLSLVLDPRAPVNATTGLLPVKAIDIPPDLYSDALSKIAVTFLTTPILGRADLVSMPVPKENGYAWSWVTDDPGKGWLVAAPIVDVNPQAAFASTRQQLTEGWLRLASLPPSGASKAK